jgi:hypothetical protein
MSQLEDNLKSSNVQLREADLARLDELTAPKPQYPNWFTDIASDPQHKQALLPA